MRSVNPATGELVREHAEHDDEEVQRRVDAAHRAFEEWRRAGAEERARPLWRAAEILRQRHDELARLAALEMGKPLTQARSEIAKCAWVCEHYAEHAAASLAPEEVETEASRSFVCFVPLGVVLAVMPWNFPFWQVFRFAAPALMAGNAVLLKHASNVPGCALAIEDVLREARLPAGLFSTLLIGARRVESVIDQPRVRAVTVTGSVSTGAQVAAAAGRRVKKTVLELGGSDAYVILADADVESAAAVCAQSRLINSGQSCIAAKRFVVVPEVRERFEALFVEHMRQARLGDPLDEETEVGPLAREDLREELRRQVEESVQRGARLLLGGEPLERRGAWFPPTVLTDVRPGMPAYEEELFGPVAAILPARDEADALRIANDSVYGLGAAVFSADIERATRIAVDGLEAGSCFVNTFVRSDPRLPFGGVKASGYGRELSVFGVREFVNVKTVYVA